MRCAMHRAADLSFALMLRPIVEKNSELHRALKRSMNTVHVLPPVSNTLSLGVAGVESSC
jgi:hypothetical protein